MAEGRDWSVLGVVLLLLLRLNTIGAQPRDQLLYGVCNDNWICVDRFTLVCVDEFCECKPGNVELDSTSSRHGQCGPPLDLGERCLEDPPDPRCGLDDTYFLTCGPSGTCECVSGYVEVDRTRCAAPLAFYQPCVENQPPRCGLDDRSGLTCVAGRCACVAGFEPGTNGGCIQQARHGQRCGPPRCREDSRWNLHCDKNACACVTGTVLQDDDERCGSKATFGERCDNPICQGTHKDDTDGPQWNLRCDTATRTCVCTDPTMVNFPDGSCKAEPGFGDRCGPTLRPCKSGANLQCRGGVCACADPTNHVEHPDKRCGPAALLGDKCGDPADPKPVCLAAGHLKCMDGGTCGCTDGHVPDGDDASVCVPWATLGDPCDPPKCATGTKWNLECEDRRCVCDPRDLQRIPAEGRCAFPARFGEPCDPPSCDGGPDWNLECDTSVHKCICKVDTVEHPELKCGAPARFGETCGPPPVCLVAGNLQCSATHTCVCLPDLYELPDKTCGTAAEHGQDCTTRPCIPDVAMECSESNGLKVCKCVGATTPAADRRSCYVPEPSKHRESCDPKAGFRCKSGVNLVCNDVFVCVCSMRWMVGGTPEGGEPGGCKVRDKSKYHEECDFDEDCDVSRNLLCKSLVRKCDCIKLHFQDPGDPTRCRRALSRYGEPCDIDAHCLQNHNMVCDPKGVCLCKAGWDLDHGVTPCKESKFGGRTYGEPCENFPVERKCVVAHNIHCVDALCACLDEYVLNEETKADPAIGVSTCRPGDGGANHGEKCEPSATTIKQRCDSRQGLECERSEKQCLCAPGYVPTGNKVTPCKPGEKVHGESCDPPEFLVRPRPIDPITGVPYPGPTSPPPPRFACNIAKNFECFKGKCICKDETVSDRYRLEPKSGTCLITAGYGCTKNEQCFSGRCISKAEAAAESGDRGPSHDHGEKVCSGSPKVKSGGNAQIQNGFFGVAATSASSILFLKYLHELELR